MMPGDGIGPEMTGYIREVFREVGAPVDFETVDLDPTTDNYDDLHNVNDLFQNFRINDNDYSNQIIKTQLNAIMSPNSRQLHR